MKIKKRNFRLLYLGCTCQKKKKKPKKKLFVTKKNPAVLGKD